VKYRVRIKESVKSTAFRLYLGLKNSDGCCITDVPSRAIHFDSIEEARNAATELVLVGCGCKGSFGLVSVEECPP